MPALLIAAASTAAFSFPSTDPGKHRLLLEAAHTTKTLNGLAGVLPWDFTAINVLERKLDYKIPVAAAKNQELTREADSPPKTDDGERTDTTIPSVKDADLQNGDAPHAMDETRTGNPVEEDALSASKDAEATNTTNDAAADSDDKPSIQNGHKNAVPERDATTTAVANGQGNPSSQGNDNYTLQTNRAESSADNTNASEKQDKLEPESPVDNTDTSEKQAKVEAEGPVAKTKTEEKQAKAEAESAANNSKTSEKQVGAEG